ncbi:MAG TPA: LytTR family DNA-binding domain-containing protein [Coriobacteriia bacterium]|jgi:two-component system response regulator LytT
MPLKALICDDEAPAREELRFLLEAAGVEIAGEAAEAVQALQLISAGAFDVIFLDVVMPGLSGIQLAEVLASLDRRPAIVFVTGHAEHAVPAFGVGAVDYLLKPVAEARLRRTLERLAPSESGRPKLERVAVEKAGKTLLIPIEDVFYVMAEGDYTHLFTGDARYFSTSSLALLESRLDVSRFFRIHRRFLVDLTKVKEVVPMYGGTLLLTLTDAAGTQLPVSRRRAASVKRALGV